MVLEDMNIAHRKFLDRIDHLANIQTYNVYEEFYARVQIVITNIDRMSMRCKRERTHHKFSSQNHMDPQSQPRVLAMPIQVVEMLIACTSPILYAMHSICEQYKYRGHTISFP